MAQRDVIVMVKWETPKRVMLPNSRTFYARYKQATCTDLPANICLERLYKGRHSRVRQGRRGFKNPFGKLKRSAKKVRNNKAFKNVVGAVFKEVPGTIRNLSKRVKNKKLKLILDGNITKTGIDLATGYKLNN